MKTFKLSILGVFAIASFVAAQLETPQDFCKRTAGPNYVPKNDTNGVFQGECETAAISICLGTEYAQSQTGATTCCLPPNTVQSASGKQGCCPPGQNFKWDGTSPSCVTPPPPPPAISCPASNMQVVNRNGQNFRIYCQRSVMVYTHPWLTTTSHGIYRAIQGPELMTNDFETCLRFCAANGRSNGANFWPAQGLCSVVDTPPGNFFKVGSRYDVPPPPYNGPQIISMVAIPKRAY
ncbi:uncharacterized protein EAE97_006310 [Botrytis byssoidea]|uniref:Apple domain-containing protein n=1 Tax=Botrytis byssoidea TaxID=139641 RepID=A0A9P5IRV3_9HELO|nr:uncharacterized protein EAE97_006310 [Botrytis byssoidea]KAF7942856.1 hypothetical protein EAE97_006310 [Botrytis byssoidea]